MKCHICGTENALFECKHYGKSVSQNKVFAPINNTIFFYHAYNLLGALDFAKKCIENNISFDFMNEFEFYITSYDEADFKRKQAFLGAEVLNENTIAS